MKLKDKNIENEWLDSLNLQGLQVPEGRGKDAVWKSIVENIESLHEKPTFPILRIASRVAAIAVAMAVVGSLAWVLIFGNTQFICPPGEHLTLLLPDSSVVNLNADSRIEFNKYIWSISRKVKLEGEALFQVKRGEAFTVRTGMVNTQVLGTTFNVYSRNNNVRVSCIEGKVAVEHSQTKQKVLLEQSQRTILAGKTLQSPDYVKQAEMATWVNGEFFFTNEKLCVVIAEIERQFNTKVKLIGNQNRLYSGIFYKSNLNEALDLVCIPMQLKWEKKNGEIIVGENQ